METSNQPNNICFCKCHELKKSRCIKCAVFHVSIEKAVTHPNDTSNPDLPFDKNN
jgi:hypothetical protein